MHVSNRCYKPDCVYWGHPLFPPKRRRRGFHRSLIANCCLGTREIAAAQLSPDGKYISFLKPWKDTRNIWVKKIDEPSRPHTFSQPRPNAPSPATSGVRDAKFILYVKDNDGDENFNVFAVDPAAAAPNGADAPPSRDLTGLKGVRIALYAAPQERPQRCLHRPQ